MIIEGLPVVAALLRDIRNRDFVKAFAAGQLLQCCRQYSFGIEMFLHIHTTVSTVLLYNMRKEKGKDF